MHSHMDKKSFKMSFEIFKVMQYIEYPCKNTWVNLVYRVINIKIKTYQLHLLGKLVVLLDEWWDVL